MTIKVFVIFIFIFIYIYIYIFQKEKGEKLPDLRGKYNDIFDLTIFVHRICGILDRLDRFSHELIQISRRLRHRRVKLRQRGVERTDFSVKSTR